MRLGTGWGAGGEELHLGSVWRTGEEVSLSSGRSNPNSLKWVLSESVEFQKEVCVKATMEQRSPS